MMKKLAAQKAREAAAKKRAEKRANPTLKIVTVCDMFEENMKWHINLGAIKSLGLENIKIHKGFMSNNKMVGKVLLFLRTEKADCTLKNNRFSLLYGYDEDPRSKKASYKEFCKIRKEAAIPLTDRQRQDRIDYLVEEDLYDPEEAHERTNNESISRALTNLSYSEANYYLKEIAERTYKCMTGT